MHILLLTGNVNLDYKEVNTEHKIQCTVDGWLQLLFYPVPIKVQVSSIGLPNLAEYPYTYQGYRPWYTD